MVDNKGYLYVLYNPIFVTYGEDVYKLVSTNNLDNRLNGYTTSFIDKSQFLYTSRCLHDAVKGERVLFFLLKNYRINNKREFFDLGIDIIIKHIKQIEECSDIQINSIYTKIKNDICPINVMDTIDDVREVRDVSCVNLDIYLFKKKETKIIETQNIKYKLTFF